MPAIAAMGAGHAIGYILTIILTTITTKLLMSSSTDMAQYQPRVVQPIYFTKTETSTQQIAAPTVFIVETMTRSTPTPKPGDMIPHPSLQEPDILSRPTREYEGFSKILSHNLGEWVAMFLEVVWLMYQLNHLQITISHQPQHSTKARPQNNIAVQKEPHDAVNGTIQSFQAKVQGLKRIIESLHVQNTSLAEEKELAASKFDHLAVELAALRSENEAIKVSAQEEAYEHQRYLEGANLVQATISTRYRRLVKQEKAVAELKSGLKKENESLKTNLEKSKTDYGNLKQELVKENEKLKIEIAKSRTSYNDLKAQSADLASKLSETETALDESKTDYSHLEQLVEQNQSLEIDLEKSQIDLAKSQSEYSYLRGQLTKENEDLRTDLAKRQTSYGHLQTQLGALFSQLEEVEAAQTEKDDERTRLHRAIDDQKMDNLTLKTKIDVLNTTVTEKESLIRSLQARTIITKNRSLHSSTPRTRSKLNTDTTPKSGSKLRWDTKPESKLIFEDATKAQPGSQDIFIFEGTKNATATSQAPTDTSCNLDTRAKRQRLHSGDAESTSTESSDIVRWQAQDLPSQTEAMPDWNKLTRVEQRDNSVTNVKNPLAKYIDNTTPERQAIDHLPNFDVASPDFRIPGLSYDEPEPETVGENKQSVYNANDTSHEDVLPANVVSDQAELLDPTLDGRTDSVHPQPSQEQSFLDSSAQVFVSNEPSLADLGYSKEDFDGLFDSAPDFILPTDEFPVEDFTSGTSTITMPDGKNWNVFGDVLNDETFGQARVPPWEDYPNSEVYPDSSIAESATYTGVDSFTAVDTGTDINPFTTANVDNGFTGSLDFENCGGNIGTGFDEMPQYMPMGECLDFQAYDPTQETLNQETSLQGISTEGNNPTESVIQQPAGAENDANIEALIDPQLLSPGSVSFEAPSTPDSQRDDSPITATTETSSSVSLDHQGVVSPPSTMPKDRSRSGSGALRAKSRRLPPRRQGNRRK